MSQRIIFQVHDGSCRSTSCLPFVLPRRVSEPVLRRARTPSPVVVQFARPAFSDALLSSWCAPPPTRARAGSSCWRFHRTPIARLEGEISRPGPTSRRRQEETVLRLRTDAAIVPQRQLIGLGFGAYEAPLALDPSMSTSSCAASNHTILRREEVPAPLLAPAICQSLS